MSDQSPQGNPNDTDAQAVLRAHVERMTQEGRVRNREGERVAALPENAQARIVEALLRKALDDDAVLVLHDDQTVTWEQP